MKELLKHIYIHIQYLQGVSVEKHFGLTFSLANSFDKVCDDNVMFNLIKHALEQKMIDIANYKTDLDHLI